MHRTDQKKVNLEKTQESSDQGSSSHLLVNSLLTSKSFKEVENKFYSYHQQITSKSIQEAKAKQASISENIKSTIRKL